MPGQNASSGRIPRNRARPSTQPQGEETNNRDTEILLHPLSYRKQRPGTKTIGTQGGYPAESKSAKSKPQGASPKEAGPRVEPPPGSLKGGADRSTRARPLDRDAPIPDVMAIAAIFSRRTQTPAGSRRYDARTSRFCRCLLADMPTLAHSPWHARNGGSKLIGESRSQ